MAPSRSKPPRRRLFHPKGVALAGTFVTTATEPALVATKLFERPPEGRQPPVRPVVVRVSRSMELPVLRRLVGVAVKVEATYGAGRDQDFVLMSSSPRRFLRRILWPTRRVDSSTLFSSLAPYRVNGEWMLVGMRLASCGPDWGADPVGALGGVNPARPVGLDLLVSPKRPVDWRCAGRITLSAPMEDVFRFTPAATGCDITPIGAFNRLRPRAYRWFQRGAGPV